MTATDKQPKEEQNNEEQPKVNTSALDSVTKDISIDDVSIDTSAVESIEKTLKKEPAPQAKPNINIRSKEDTLWIWDITSYIQQRKAKQEAENSTETLNAKDWTDLQSLPGVFAVVPHKKGDHKLVFMRDDVDESFIVDPKNRKKWGVYEKNGIKVYDVHADFMQHPTLKTTRGESFTIWVVDTKEDLQNQLQSIQGWAWRGTNFMSPVYIESKKKEETKKEAPTPAKKVEPVKEKKEVSKKSEEPKAQPKKKVNKTENDTLKKKEEATPKNEETKDKPFELPKFELPKESKKTETPKKDKAPIEPVKKEVKKEVKKTPTPAPTPTPVVEKIPEPKSEKPKKAEVKTDTPTTERKLPEFKEEAGTKPVNVDKVVAQGDKKNNAKEEKPFVLPTFDFDKEGNVVKEEKKAEETKTPAPIKKEEKPFTLPEITPPPVEPKNEPAPIKKEVPEKKVEPVQKEEKKETPPPFMLDLDDILPKKDTPSPEIKEEVKAEIPTPTPVSVPKPTLIPTPPVPTPVVEKSPELTIETPEPKKEEITTPKVVPEVTIEKPVFDLDAITEISPEAKSETVPEKPKEAPAMDLDSLTQEVPKEQPVAVEETTPTTSTPTEKKHRHSRLPKRSKKGLKIRIAGLIALPLLLLAVLIVMFPSIKGGEKTPKPDQVVENPVEPIPTQPTEPIAVDPVAPDPTPTQPTAQFTMSELKSKLEGQQIEARRVLNKAKLLGNRDAIKFGTAALLKASKSLDKITKNTTTADEVQNDAQKIEYYLEQADNAIN